MTAADTPQIRGYDILAPIGEGGMSTVWKAWDPAHRRPVAIKILDSRYAADTAQIRAFREEARLMAEIRHPGIVEAYDFDNAHGNWYIVMEFVDGYTFADLLRRKSAVCQNDCLSICESLAAALNTVWNDHGIVHCDIKPENIMINSRGIVKLTDLGISQRFNLRADGEKNVPDHITGTPAYISPEQIYGDVELDCRTDIYSLGATLYHLATGRVLFPDLDNEATMRAHCDESVQAPDPRLFQDALTEGFAQLLEAMLVKDRNSRVHDWRDIFSMCCDVESGMAFKPRQTPGVSSLRLLTSGPAAG
jgi:serine/threonine-protein kinase